MLGRNSAASRSPTSRPGSGVGLELFEAIDPPHERREESIEFWKSGTFHFCVTDPDIEGLVDKIVATGGRQLPGSGTTGPLGRISWSITRIPTARSSEIHTHSYEIVQGWRSAE